MARGLTSDSDLAEDVVQDSYLAALVHPPRDQSGSSRGWLATVLRNRLFSHGRRLQRHARLSGRLGTSAEPVPSPEDLTAEMEMRRLVAGLVLELPEPLRQVVLLCAVEGLTSQQAATRLGIASGTVRWRLKTALHELRMGLDRRHAGDRKAWVSILAPMLRVGVGVRFPLAGWAAAAASFLLVGTALVFFLRDGPQVSKLSKPSPGVAAGLPSTFGSTDVLDSAPNDDRSSAIEGIVRDPQGRPVVGAVVAAYRQQQWWALPNEGRVPRGIRTTEGGRFRLEGLLPGEYRVTASGFEGTPALRTVTLERGSTLQVTAMTVVFSDSKGFDREMFP